MACAVAFPVLEPSRDFPAWLETHGVNAEVARAMDSELGIRDYGVLRACVGDGLVRAELLATARDRLPFGFYAVLRQVVKALQGAEPHDDDGTTPRWDDASSSPGDVTLGSLVEALLALFNGLSRELLLCVRRLGEWDGANHRTASSATDAGSPDMAATEMDYDELEEMSTPIVDVFRRNLTVNRIKMEPFGDISTNPAAASRISERDSTAQTANEPRGGKGGQRSLFGHPRLAVQNMTSPPASRTSAGHAAEGQTHPWKQQQQQRDAGETHGDEAAAASAATNRSSAPTYRQRTTLSSNHRRRRLTPASSVGDEVGESYQGGPGGPVEGAGERPLWCELCGRSCARASELRRHLRAHYGRRAHRCGVCGDAVSRGDGGDARPHLRAHAAERPFRCDVCGKEFSRATVLRFHQRLHGDDSP